jgi:hypothetical protein
LPNKPESQLPWDFEVMDTEGTITKQSSVAASSGLSGLIIYGKNDYQASLSRSFLGMSTLWKERLPSEEIDKSHLLKRSSDPLIYQLVDGFGQALVNHMLNAQLRI